MGFFSQQHHHTNASFVLRLPSSPLGSGGNDDGDSPFSEFSVHIEFLNSYTTAGVLDLKSWTAHPSSSDSNEGTHNITHSHFSNASATSAASSSCQGWRALHSEMLSDSGSMMESLNATNSEHLSVSKSLKFSVNNKSLYVEGTIHGGDFHLLSLAVYCV